MKTISSAGGKRLAVTIIGIVVIGIVVVMAQSPPERSEAAKERRKESIVRDFDLGMATADEIRNLVRGYGERIDVQRQELQDLQGKFEEARKELQEAIQNQSDSRLSEFARLEEWLKQLQAIVGIGKSEPLGTILNGPARFRLFEFGSGTDERVAKSVHIPAGSFGEATLLTGVYAPTTGEAMPVLMKLEAALMGPSKSRVPIEGAFLVGKAQGDANSRRAVVQLETLSVVKPEGQAIESKVNGWVIDRDGIQGLAGRYVWRAEEIAALAALSGGLSAGSEAAAARETVSAVTPLGGVTGSVTGDPVRFTGFRALSGTLDKIAELLATRMNEVVPAVYVENGKRITIAFINGVTLEEFQPDKISQEGTKPFEGIDWEP